MKLVTWNVLADAYIRRDYYPLSSDADLDPSSRRRALCEHLEAFEADVICLQEVEPDAFEAFTRVLVSGQARFARKGRGKPDGCATFVRAPWTITAEQVLHYPDGDPASGHLAHTLTVSHDAHSVAISNTHLRWAEPSLNPSQHVGCVQADLLLAARPPGPWIVCGDLNAAPGEPLIERLRSRGLTATHPDHAATCNADGRVRKIDYVLHTHELRATPIQPPALTDRTPMPSSTHPSDHLALAASFAWVEPET